MLDLWVPIDCVLMFDDASGFSFDVPVVRDLAKAGRLDEMEVLYWVGCSVASMSATSA